MEAPHESAGRPRNKSSVRLPSGGLEQIVALVFKEELSIPARLLLIWAAQTQHESITVGKIFDELGIKRQTWENIKDELQDLNLLDAGFQLVEGRRIHYLDFKLNKLQN
jgi:hypothetical protein